MKNRSRAGIYVDTTVAGDRVRAFVPAPLVGAPTVDLGDHYEMLDRASRALGRLDGLSTLLPDTKLFLYGYVRKEALLSSQIEGTQSSLADLLLFEAEQQPAVPIRDVEEVSNYVAALEHGLARLRAGFPLSLRLLREIHAILLRGGRGAGKGAGEFRRTQNWVGGATPREAAFVPPPPDRLAACLDDFEKFLHAARPPMPALVRAALAHVQFETIHPFLDGNGRLGRLLVTLFLCERDMLHEPLLYLSLHFKRHRQRYYDLLQRTRLNGDWGPWIAFFLEGVALVAEQAADTAVRIRSLFEQDRTRTLALGRPAASALRVHELLQRRPYLTVAQVAAALSLSRPTAAKAMAHLAELTIVRELSGRSWGRLYAYERYVAILNEDGRPLRA